MKTKSPHHSSFGDLEKTVLDFFQANVRKTFKAKDIAKSLHIPQQQYQALRTVLRSLLQQNKIHKLKKNRYGIFRQTEGVVGQLRVNSQGYGFVTRPDGPDVFISEKNMATALHLDTVRVKLFAASEGKSPEGMVIEVVERARNHFVGTFRRGRKYGYVIPDDLKIHKDIIIPDREDHGALDGQKVVAVIDEWEHAQLNPTGHLREILGFPEEPGVDVLSILHQFNLPDAFPEAVLHETEKISPIHPKQEVARRLDLRDQIVFTIDPADAKDFDDAVSLQKLPNGHLRLGVHIADVSYYVEENGAIDAEAKDRGTSVYLVDRVVPMLPERLSNELCSLAEGQDRFCYSVFVDLTPEGEVLQYQLKETLINSVKRLSYEQAQRIIAGEEKSSLTPLLREMHALSRKLVQKRFRRGSIDFESLEVKIILDDQGHPTDIIRRERLDSHRLIEEFMLLANETVAKHIATLPLPTEEESWPFVYRIHEKPDDTSMTELLNLATAFSVPYKAPKQPTPKFLQKLSFQFQEHPAGTVLQDALLRTMMKARYSTDNLGHFGLAYHHYTHFTSPIRRYPDLMVHRLLKKYTSKAAAFPVDLDELEKSCHLATQREIRAQEAERASVKLKQVEFMERHLGKEFQGIIARIVNFGFFVHIPELLIDGLVHVTSLEDDYYIFEEKNFCLTGQYNRKRYRLGDRIRVRVSRVSRNERLIDFIIA